jgi:hypothetical protein
VDDLLPRPAKAAEGEEAGGESDAVIGGGAGINPHTANSAEG